MANEMLPYYDARAAEYDDFYLGCRRFSDQRRVIAADIDMIAPILTDFGEGRILDIACGTSFFAKWYAERSQSVVGMDASPAMLSQSISRYASLQIRGSLVRADAFALPFALASFDRIFVGFLLSHLSDGEIKGLLGEVKSKLKPGGKLAIVDGAWTDERVSQSKSRIGMQRRALNDGRMFEIFKRYFTGDELGRILGEAEVSSYRVEIGNVFIWAVCDFG